jgi:hypothetical protein
MAHYTGKLTNGKVFDSSGSRHKPFQFIVGIGQVIKGWDVGFLSMEKGEKANLTCTGPYAYGEDGAGDDIPPNATLIFEVEMLDFGAPGSGVGKGLTEDQRHGHSHAEHGHSHEGKHGHSHGDGTPPCTVQ